MMYQRYINVIAQIHETHRKNAELKGAKKAYSKYVRHPETILEMLRDVLRISITLQKYLETMLWLLLIELWCCRLLFDVCWLFACCLCGYGSRKVHKSNQNTIASYTVRYQEHIPGSPHELSIPGFTDQATWGRLR